MHAFRLIRPFLTQRRHAIAAGILCLMVVDTLQLFIPRIIKRAVDDLTLLATDIRCLALYAGWIILIAAAMAVLRFVWRRLLIGASREIEKDLRNNLFFHIQTLSASYFDRTRTGDLMAHATNDINNIRMAAGMGMVALTDAVFLGSAAIGFMLWINVRLTLFALIPMPAVVILSRTFGKKMHRRYTRVQETFSALTESVRESFSGIRIVKAFNRENLETARVAGVSETYIRENLSLIAITGSFFPLLVLFTNLSLAIILLVGGRQAVLAVITPGDFVAFISYLNLLTWPMMAMGWVVNLIQRGAASMDRLNKILSTPPDVTDPATAVGDPRVEILPKGEISFDAVGFSYPSSGTPALADIHLHAGPGRVIGIVGPQGSGKTTLLKLIPRIYDVSAGSIRLDGRDIRSLSLEDLRKPIGFVSQEPFLFSGTIRENITFGAIDDDTALIRAARAAAVYDTIREFPDGFDTIIGEKGVMLSGGQKQRIVLARALIREPKILLLDDPVGQVDTQTAAAIIRAIREISRDRTILISSHRIAAISYADEILVLDGGRITARGTHDGLLAENPYYARSHAIQRAEEMEG